MKRARPGWLCAALVAALMVAAPAYSVSTQIGAPANVMLAKGSHGKRVKALQWLLGNHDPNVYRRTKIRATFKAKPNGLFGERTGKAVVDYKWQLGYPKRLLRPIAGPYFFGLLTGKERRPVKWIAIAAKRATMPVPGPTALALKVRKVALSQLGVTEVPLGSNCGALVYQYQRVTGAICAAWCVSFAQWTYRTAGAPSFAYNTASVYVAVDWARYRGFLRARAKVGALVAFIDYDRYGHRIPGTGHMGVVVKVLASGFVSVEGNASNRVLERYHPNGERPHVFIYVPGVA